VCKGGGFAGAKGILFVSCITCRRILWWMAATTLDEHGK
jgi:hypothetical protein